MNKSEALHRTGQSIQNLELNPLFNPWGFILLIPLTMVGYKC